MTREEHLDWLYRLRSEIYVYMPKEWLIPMSNALDIAIKALEQQPCNTDTCKVVKAYMNGWDKPNNSDAISRQAVNTLVDELARAISDERCFMPRGRATSTIMQDILDLPPVRPQEPSGETVSLEAFKQVMRERDIAIEQLHELSYEFGQKIEPSGDAISRQAAFEAFGLSEATRKYGGNHSGYDTLMKYEIQDVLESLPPVTPQPSGDAIDRAKAIYIASGYCHFSNIAKELAKLPSVNPQPKMGQWLRMSDLSEQEDDRYKCSRCGNVVHHTNKMNLYTFNSWCGRCGSDNGRHINYEVEE